MPRNIFVCQFVFHLNISLGVWIIVRSVHDLKVYNLSVVCGTFYFHLAEYFC